VVVRAALLLLLHLLLMRLLRLLVRPRCVWVASYVAVCSSCPPTLLPFCPESRVLNLEPQGPRGWRGYLKLLLGSRRSGLSRGGSSASDSQHHSKGAWPSFQACLLSFIDAEVGAEAFLSWNVNGRKGSKRVSDQNDSGSCR